MRARTETIRQVFDWSDQAAVERTTDMAALAVAHGLTALPQLRAVQAAAAELQAALACEVRAEVRDRDAEARAVRAQEALQAAFRPRLEEASMAGLRARLRPALATWADPYATDATGRVQLAGLRAQLIEEPARQVAGVAAMRMAVDAMEAAGGARDRAHQERLASIAQRVAARRRWNAALEVLLASMDDGVVAAWLSGFDECRQATFPEADWFQDDD